MIRFTERLDKAIRVAAWAHEQQEQHRKGSDIPYIIHPFGVMLVAGQVTEDEDILISCLLHDVIEDVDPTIYDRDKMSEDFGENVLEMVLDVSKDESIDDWHERSNAYLHHLEHGAVDGAVIVSAADKIHNLQSMITDYKAVGNELWNRFSTQNSDDQLWWYRSILEVISKRNAPQPLQDALSAMIIELEELLNTVK